MTVATTGALPLEYRAPYLGPDGAWTRRAAGVAALLTAGSFAGIVVAWVGASGQTHLGDEIPWLVVGVLALTVGGIAGATWLGRGLRSIRTERLALRRRLVAMDVGRPAAAGRSDIWMIAPGMTRVHRPDCEYLRGKTAREVAPGSAPECVVCS
jgi:hypothetical protein